MQRVPEKNGNLYVYKEVYKAVYPYRYYRFGTWTILQDFLYVLARHEY